MWIIGILLSATAVFVGEAAPQWLVIGTAGLCAMFSLLYFYAYIFCLHGNPDHLRSESYSLNKIAIEHGIYGDSITGTFENNSTNPKLIEQSSADKKEEE